MIYRDRYKALKNGHGTKHLEIDICDMCSEMKIWSKHWEMHIGTNHCEMDIST